MMVRVSLNLRTVSVNPNRLQPTSVLKKNNSSIEVLVYLSSGNSASATALGTVSDKSQTESGSVVLGTSQQYAFFVYHRQSISQYRGFLLSFNKVGMYMYVFERHVFYHISVIHLFINL